MGIFMNKYISWILIGLGVVGGFMAIGEVTLRGLLGTALFIVGFAAFERKFNMFKWDDKYTEEGPLSDLMDKVESKE